MECIHPVVLIIQCIRQGPQTTFLYVHATILYACQSRQIGHTRVSALHLCNLSPSNAFQAQNFRHIMASKCSTTTRSGPAITPQRVSLIVGMSMQAMNKPRCNQTARPHISLTICEELLLDPAVRAHVCLETRSVCEFSNDLQCGVLCHLLPKRVVMTTLSAPAPLYSQYAHIGL